CRPSTTASRYSMVPRSSPSCRSSHLIRKSRSSSGSAITSNVTTCTKTRAGENQRDGKQFHFFSVVASPSNLTWNNSGAAAPSNRTNRRTQQTRQRPHQQASHAATSAHHPDISRKDVLFAPALLQLPAGLVLLQLRPHLRPLPAQVAPHLVADSFLVPVSVL